MNDLHQSFLSTHKILSFLPPNEAQSLKEKAILKTHEEGDLVIEEGQHAQFLFIVFDGTLSVYVEDFDGSKELAVLNKGDFMGEISVISNQPTSASVKCLSKVVLIGIPKESILCLKDKNPALWQFLSRTSIDRFEANLSKQI
jgi:CRP-like cAMP-binding protein